MASALQTNLAAYRAGGNAAFLVASHTAGSLPVNFFTARQPAGSYPFPARSELMLALAIRMDGQVSLDFGAGRWAGRSRSGDLFVVPPNVAPEFSVDRANEYLNVGIDFSALRSLLSQIRSDFQDFGRLHGAPFQSRLIEALLTRLWAEAAQQTPLSRLFVDSAMQTLAIELLRISGYCSDNDRLQLSSTKLHRTIEYIDQHLAENFSIADLAEVASMSAYEYARAFKKAVGIPPLRYVTERRIERAKEMLGNSQLPVIDIALALGFPSSQHFATVFGRQVGVTPTKFRKDRLS